MSGADGSVALVPGIAQGRVLMLDEPLSFWGGLDAETGRIIDRRHPQHGSRVTDRILVMTSGRGSSSSSSVLAEAIRVGTSPIAVILRDPDAIVALGALVAEELYGRTIPVIVAAQGSWDQLEDDLEIFIEDDRILTPFAG